MTLTPEGSAAVARELTRWLGERLEALLPGRFAYVAADLPLDDHALARLAASLRLLGEAA